jgi:hypothetical protein
VQENWLSSYMEFFDKGYKIVGCEGWKMKKDFYPCKRVKDKNDYFSYVGGGGMMMESSLFSGLGKFEEWYDMKYFEDPCICFRAYYLGYKIAWNHHPVIIHEHKGKLLSEENKKYFMGNWEKFREKWRGISVPVLRMDKVIS